MTTGQDASKSRSARQSELPQSSHSFPPALQNAYSASYYPRAFLLLTLLGYDHVPVAILLARQADGQMCTAALYLLNTNSTTASAPPPDSTSIVYPSPLVCAANALGKMKRLVQVNRALSWGARPARRHVTEPSMPRATLVDWQRNRRLPPGAITSGIPVAREFSHFPLRSCADSGSSSSWRELWLRMRIVTRREPRLRVEDSCL